MKVHRNKQTTGHVTTTIPRHYLSFVSSDLRRIAAGISDTEEMSIQYE